MALALHKGDPIPDISTVEKLAAVLKSADSVMRSNPAGGSMVAAIIEKMLQRPEFAGVKSKISSYGEGGQALARGEGQMAIQAECEIINHPDTLANAGPVPDELGAYMDMVAAVSIRSANPKQAADWLKYATQPGTYSLWLGKGLERLNRAPRNCRMRNVRTRSGLGLWPGHWCDQTLVHKRPSGLIFV
jgi:molybdate transport system substrate-binding protein